MISLIIPTSALITTVLILAFSISKGSLLSDNQELKEITKTFLPMSGELFYYFISSLAILGVNYLIIISSSNVSETLNKSTQYYGLVGLFLIYVTLLPGLLRVLFPHFVLNGLFLTARRAFGLSAFFFSALHALLAFIYYFHGTLATYNHLSPSFQLAFIFAVAALFILFLMAATSFNAAERTLGPKLWKSLHRLVYLAGILIVLHAFIRGVNFREHPNFATFMNYFTLTFIFLEIGATAKELYLRRKMRPVVLTSLYYLILTFFSIVAFLVSASQKV